MKVLSVVAARPQFVKAVMVSRAVRESGAHEIIVHTGQHYDTLLSDIFFTQLGIPQPDYNLGVGSGSHGYQTGETMIRLEKVIQDANPDFMFIYGDVNATTSAALVAAKLHIPYGHVEAGLRSYDKRMPEEINRIVADRFASLLFCPTEQAVNNLYSEGLTEGIYMVGDVMYDASLYYQKMAVKNSDILKRLGMEKEGFDLLTVHRNFNTDRMERLKSIVYGVLEAGYPTIFPVHPRTRKMLIEYDIKLPDNINLIEPVSYLDMIQLEANCRCIVTDSGGVQKEAYFFKKPCIVLRNTTEWMELVEEGWAILVDCDPTRIKNALFSPPLGQSDKQLYGDGRAAEKIWEITQTYLNKGLHNIKE